MADRRPIRRALLSSRESTRLGDAVARCRDQGIATIAEIVESEEQAWRLRHMGFDLAQGFAFAPPRPKPDYTRPEKLSGPVIGHA